LHCKEEQQVSILLIKAPDVLFVYAILLMLEKSLNYKAIRVEFALSAIIIGSLDSNYEI
jgi:hypothetical protein